jgi:hypothetical protein
MECLLMPVVIAVLAYANRVIVRQLLRRQAGRGWWLVLFGAWVVGAAVGVWSTFSFEYRLSPNTRVLGAPMPMAAFHLEGPPGEEQWADYVNALLPLVICENGVTLALLASFPVSLTFWLWSRNAKRGVSHTGT